MQPARSESYKPPEPARRKPGMPSVSKPTAARTGITSAETSAAAAQQALAEAPREVNRTEVTDPHAQIRIITRGDSGKGPLVDRGRDEPVIIPGKGLKDLPPGTPVVIYRVDRPEGKHFWVAEGEPIEGRVVVVGYRDRSRESKAALAQKTGYVSGLSIDPDWVEMETEIDKTWWADGILGGGIQTYSLIKPDREAEVREQFSWGLFKDIAIKGLGFDRLVREAPADMTDEEILSKWVPEESQLQVFFAPTAPDRKIAGHMLDQEKGTVAEITRRHLAPIVVWLRRIARGEITGYEKAPSIEEWLAQHREAFTQQNGPSQVNREAVISYLLASRSEFPDPNGGLETMGEMEAVAAARAWSHGKEAAAVVEGANKERKQYPTIFSEKLTLSAAAKRHLELGRPPALEDLVDRKKIEELYPPEVELPGVGKVTVQYSRKGEGGQVGTIHLSPAQTLAAESDPEIPGRECLFVYSDEVSSNFVPPQSLVEQKRRTAKYLSREVFREKKGGLPFIQEGWWENKPGNELPAWPPGRVVGEVKGVGEVLAYPYIYRATANGITAVGWTQSEKEVDVARKKFEQAREVWEARRGEAEAICGQCGGKMVKVEGEWAGSKKTSFKCGSCEKAPEYPFISDRYNSRRGGRVVEVYFANTQATSFGESFDLSENGPMTGPVHGVGQRPATLDEIDRLEIAAAKFGLANDELVSQSIVAGRKKMADLLESLVSDNPVGKIQHDVFRDLLAQLPDFIALLPVMTSAGSVICDPQVLAKALTGGRENLFPELEYGYFDTHSGRNVVLSPRLGAIMGRYYRNEQEGNATYLARFTGDPR